MAGTVAERPARPAGSRTSVVRGESRLHSLPAGDEKSEIQMRLIVSTLAPAAALAAACAATPALAEEVKIAPTLDARLRYEAVDQDGLPREADALTLRARPGLTVGTGDWSLLVEGEGMLAIVEDYNSGLNGNAARPIVGDPENIELNRLQIQYRGLPGTVITLGRQRINLEDQRFVGAVGWRQNEQTFDAVRLEWNGIEGLKADVTYSWSVRTIWGRDGEGPRQQAISGDNVFATVGYGTPIGTLSGFAYLVDQDEAAVSGFQLSSQTYGVRLAGTQPLSKTARLNYAASYARQSDWHRNPNDYSADYWLAEAGLDLGMVRLGVGYEVLGADDGRPLTSFQTPLATLHKFQGWADKFLTTPPDGIRDLHASAGLGWKTVGPLEAVSLQAVWHRFESDRRDLHYGNEIGLSASAKVDRFTFTIKYADYDADRFATDTSKVWLQLECSY